MADGLVSILIPTLEAGEFLAEAIQSVLNQTYPSWELILIDGGSTDGTSHLYHHYQELDRRATKKNRLAMLIEPGLGIADALNRGVQKAQGQYLMSLGADDLLPEDRLATQVKYLTSHPEVDVVYSDYLEIDHRGVPLKLFTTGKIESAKVKLADVVASQIVPTDTMLAKRQLYLDYPYRSGQGIYADDHYLIANWYKHQAVFRKLPAAALLKRYHDNQHYRVHFEMYDSRSKKLKEVFNED